MIVEASSIGVLTNSTLQRIGVAVGVTVGVFVGVGVGVMIDPFS